MEKVAIVGLGLIGGSMGLGLKRALPDLEVAGFDTDAGTLRGALERGAVDRLGRDLETTVGGADLVVVATPVDVAPAVLEEMSNVVAPEAAVTDTGSAKRVVVEAGQRAFGQRFVGGHPMAGSERHGIEAADPELFDDAWWILTPTALTSSASYAAVGDLVSRMGAKTVAVDPEAHDALVARLSHLPQVTASALVDVAHAAGDKEALLGLAAGGFRDVTRIAASNPDLWVAILRSNRESVLEAMSGLGDRLRAIEELLRGGRWDELRSWLESARSTRVGMFAKPSYGGEPVGLTFLIPDRPGVLAEVTTAAGRLGVNIEDLRIVHSTEGGRGRLELIVTGREQAEALVGELLGLGYHPDRMQVDI